MVVKKAPVAKCASKSGLSANGELVKSESVFVDVEEISIDMFGWEREIL